MLDWLVTLKGEPRKVKYEIVDFELQLMAHNGSAFDTYIGLNNLPNWHRLIDIINNGKGIISLNFINGYYKISENKTVPQFRCGMTPKNTSF